MSAVVPLPSSPATKPTRQSRTAHVSAACTLTVTPNRYNNGPARSHMLAAGASVDDSWSIAASGHWYDLSVTSSADALYLRRIAGHMENGLASISDPAIG